MRNFYKPILRKSASDKELMVVSYITTTVLGGLIILSALFFSKLEGMNLFDLNMRLGAMISLPFMIPLTLGLIFKNTPSWAGWSTVTFGMLLSYIIQNHVTPEMVASKIGILEGLSTRESIDIMFYKRNNHYYFV